MSRTAKITPERAALLRLVRAQPHVTAPIVSNTIGVAQGKHLAELVNVGLLDTHKLQQINGNASRSYTITPRGLAALTAFRSDTREARSASTQAQSNSGPYACPELGRTCLRPGAYEAFEFPSLISGKRVYPRGVA